MSHNQNDRRDGKDESDGKTQQMNAKTPVRTDYKTMACLLTVAATVGVMWNDLKRDIRDIKSESAHCAQVDDMTRFGTQLQALNPSVRVPLPPEYQHGAQQIMSHQERN
jgi:hypothetical protein